MLWAANFRRREQCQEEVNRNIAANKNVRPSTLKRVTKSTGLRKKKQNAALGRPSTNQPVVEKRADLGGAKKRARRARAKGEGKAGKLRVAAAKRRNDDLMCA